MPTESKPQGLVSALATIQAKMPVVRKGETAKVPTKAGGSYSYSYADLSDVAQAVYPLLSDVGLVFVAMPTFREQRYVLVGEIAHTSGESRSGEFPLPERGTPQELGSAITYGRRYLLGCLTGIVTGDQDDDGAAASRPSQRRERPAQTEPTEPTPASLRGEIATLGIASGMTHDEIKDDFAAFSEGERITDAGVEMLTRYRDSLKKVA